MGDTSSSSVRKERFDVIDEDHSDSIDFEEFLHVSNSFLSKQLTILILVLFLIDFQINEQ